MTDDNDDLEFGWVDGSETEPSPPELQVQQSTLDEPGLAAAAARGERAPGARRRRPTSRKIWIRRAIALTVVAVLGFAAWFFISLFQPFAGAGSGRIEVNIARGETPSEVADELAHEGVVSSSFFFDLRARLDGDRSKYRAGVFVMRRGMSYSAALAALTGPQAVREVSLTLPEGYTRAEIATRAKTAGLRGDYLLASRPTRAFNPQMYGASSSVHKLEGFLFPATYFDFPHANVSHLVAQQLQAFQQNFDQLDFARARAAHLSRYDVLIIASMIEREAQVPSDRAKVAAVIYNRLKDNIPLGVDATLRYALNDYTHPLTESELASDTPYNTRIHRGLPPTPISNPGVASMLAATDPAHVSYLYYVDKPNTCGQLAFATTNAQFQTEVNAYNAARDANGGRAHEVPVSENHRPGRLGVIGWPVFHSRSPAMQNAAFAALGLEGFVYQHLPAPVELFPEILRALPAAGFVGANVTVPHKHVALAMADVTTEAVRAIGAANSLSFASDGAIHADNTDAPGMIDAIGRELRGTTAMILGAGGTARAAAWALREAGSEVWIWNRTPERAAQLARDLEVQAVAVPAAATILVNTTTVGMDESTSTGDALRSFGLDSDAIESYEQVVDFVYSSRPTALVTEARRRGVATVDGLQILVTQGARSFLQWTGRVAPLQVMRAAAEGGGNG